MHHGEGQSLDIKQKENQQIKLLTFPLGPQTSCKGVGEHPYAYPRFRKDHYFWVFVLIFPDPISWLTTPVGNQYPAFEFGIALLSCMASLHAFKIYQLCFVFLSLWTSNWLILCIHLWLFLSTLYDRCCQEWALYWKSEPCFVYPGEFRTVACSDTVSICPLNSVLYPPHDSPPCLPCNPYQLFTGSLVLREKIPHDLLHHCLPESLRMLFELHWSPCSWNLPLAYPSTLGLCAGLSSDGRSSDIPCPSYLVRFSK